jgi:hypothetical protein
MPAPDECSSYLDDLDNGTCDPADGISLPGYFPMGQTSGGLLAWQNPARPVWG